MMQIYGKVGLAEHFLPRLRVCKHEFCGVEKLAFQPKAPPAVAAAVLLVAAHRVPDGRQVDADLVGPAGLERDSQERRTRVLPLDLEVRARLARAVRADRMDGPVAAVAADRRVDRAGA